MQGFSYGHSVNKLAIIGTKGTEQMLKRIESYIKEWRKEPEETYIVNASFPRFGSGEAKGLINESVRDRDVFIVADCFNYGVTYDMYQIKVPMSPDDHYQDLKRIIGAIGGKASRISVIMPMLYEGRQHRVSGRESLDCALMLHELNNMGVNNFMTFDAHDDRVRNAMPLQGFDNLMPSYQMLKSFVKNVPNVNIKDLVIVSPDEGALSRGMYYSSVMGVNLSMFYKKRDYSRVENGRNPIIAHQYLGDDISGKDVIVVDDIISSGESLLHILDLLKEKKAARIFAFMAFGLFCNGFKLFDEYYKKGRFDKIFTTNSIYITEELKSKSWYQEVNVLKYIAYYIEALSKHNSVSKIIDPTQKIQVLLSNLENK